MYSEHLEAAWNAHVGSSRLKVVLLAYAHHACEVCGLAWPGIPRIAERCEGNVKGIRMLVHQLVADGHLEMFSHARGGRGCTTIYRVLPGAVPRDRVPCEKCWVNLRLTPKSRSAVGPQQLDLGSPPDSTGKPSPEREGIEGGNTPVGAWVSEKAPRVGEGFGKTGNPPGTARVSGLPSRFGRKTLPPGGRRTVREDEQSTGAHAREAVAAPPRSDSPNPRPPSPSVGDGLRKLGLPASHSLDAIAMHPAIAVTAPDKGKAQPSVQARNGTPRSRGRPALAPAVAGADTGGHTAHEDDG